jgi:hypothetical protein
VTAATVEAVVVTDGRARSVRLEYSHVPTLGDVVFEVLQAGTPPEVRGLGTAVERRIVWSLTDALRGARAAATTESSPSPKSEGGADVASPELGEGMSN